MRIESDTLHLAGPSNARSFVHVGIAHPTPSEENAFGKLYTLVEIDSSERVNQAIISSLQEEIRTSYYHSIALNIETSFESALHEANRRLHGFISEGATSWLDHFNAIVAVMKGEVVTISPVGRIHAFLFRGNRIVDIVGRGAVEDKKNPLKIFSSLFTGHVQPLDRLLLCTSSLLDFFSLEKLKRLITEDLPSTTIARVERILLAHPTPVPFAAILFAFLPQEEPQPGSALNSLPSRPPTTPQRSMDELIAKVRATEQLLSPSILPNVSETWRTLTNRLQTFFRTKILGLPPRRKPPLSPVRSSRVFLGTSRPARFMRGLQRLGIRLILFVFSIPRLIRRLVGRSETVTKGVRELPQRTTGNARRFLRWIRMLTPIQKGFLLGAIVILFILSQSIVGARLSASKKTRLATATATAATIEKNLDRASAALTYEDYTGAKGLLDESSRLLETLPSRTRNDKDRRAELLKKINAVREHTRRVEVPAFTSVASLSTAFDNIVPSSIALAGTTLLIGSEETDRLLRVNLDDGSLKGLKTDTPGVRFLLGLNTQTIVLGTTDNTIDEFSLPTNSLRHLTIPFSNVDRAFTGGALFQSRLYLLDTKNNAILRLPRSASGFGSPTQWFKDSSVEVRDGIGIAVDGAVYIATKNGAINRFSAGTRDDLTFEEVDPRLQSPAAIWTNEQSPSLYILEPAQQRLLVFKKSSRTLTRQLVHESFSRARSFAVDERKKTLYVLTEDAILRANLGQ